MKSVVLVLFLTALVLAGAAPLLHADAPNVIPGTYMVVFKESYEALDRDAYVLALQDTITATNANAKVMSTFQIGSLIGFSARLTDDLLKQQLDHPDVRYVEADQVVSINFEVSKGERPPLAAGVITQTGAVWGLDRISRRSLPLSTTYVYPETAGRDVDVYIVDTGILLTHVDFEGRAVSVFNAINNELPTDLNGHGTHCAGTVGGAKYGVAKEVSLKSAKVLSASGSGAWTGIVDACDYIARNQNKSRASIASLSLGGGISTIADEAVAKAIEAQVNFVIAGGNSNANACNYSPARVPTAVTVGATDSNDYRASYSNYGTCTTVFAPGTSITSDWIGSNTATNTISGTSMATPHVAGILALHLHGVTDETPAQTKAWLASVATTNAVLNPGTGSPNLLAYSPTDNEI